MKECDWESVLSIIIVLLIYCLGSIAQYHTFWKKLLTYILSEIVQKCRWYFTWEKNPLTLARTTEEMDGILYTYIVDHPSMMSQRKTLWGLSSWKIPQKYSVKTSRGLPKGSFFGTSLTVHPPPLVPQVEMWFMPCPFSGPKMFWADPNFLCQTKNLFTHCGSHKHFVPDKKMICIQ